MDISEFEKNPLSNIIFRSSYTNDRSDRKYFLGIDEAGRGPVLGKTSLSDQMKKKISGLFIDTFE